MDDFLPSFIGPVVVTLFSKDKPGFPKEGFMWKRKKQTANIPFILLLPTREHSKRDAILRKQKLKKRKCLSGYAELIFQIFGPHYSRLSNLCIKKLKFWLKVITWNCKEKTLLLQWINIDKSSLMLLHSWSTYKIQVTKLIYLTVKILCPK